MFDDCGDISEKKNIKFSNAAGPNINHLSARNRSEQEAQDVLGSGERLRDSTSGAR